MVARFQCEDLPSYRALRANVWFTIAAGGATRWLACASKDGGLSGDQSSETSHFLVWQCHSLASGGGAPWCRARFLFYGKLASWHSKNWSFSWVRRHHPSWLQRAP